MEAGFSSRVPGMSCLGSNTVPAGIDTKQAEHMVAAFCSGQTVSVLDSCGGHAVPYHYHESMSCLYSESNAAGLAGHSTRVGTALDGNGIYGKDIEGGVEPTDLDACGGRVGATPDSNGAPVYYYVTSNAAPFTVGCFGSVATYPVSVAQCRALYPRGCLDSRKLCIKTVQGSGWYVPDCPCYDGATQSNVLSVAGVPGFMAGGTDLSDGCTLATPASSSPTPSSSPAPQSTTTSKRSKTSKNGKTSKKTKATKGGRQSEAENGNQMQGQSRGLNPWGNGE